MEEIRKIYLVTDHKGTFQIDVDSITSSYILIDEFKYEEKYYYLYRSKPEIPVQIHRNRKSLFTRLFGNLCNT